MMPELRQISSLDTSEPATRFHIGFRKAFLANGPIDCEWDDHSTAGYLAGKQAKDEMYQLISQVYGTTFVMMKAK